MESSIDDLNKNKANINHTHASVPYAEVANVARSLNPLNTSGNGYEENNYIYAKLIDGAYNLFCIQTNPRRNVQCSVKYSKLANYLQSYNISNDTHGDNFLLKAKWNGTVFGLHVIDHVDGNFIHECITAKAQELQPSWGTH